MTLQPYENNSMWIWMRRRVVACGAIALLLSVSSYPFFPQQTMINFSWTVLLLLSGLYMLIFAQMSRNYVLSRIASKPTGFTLDRVFVSQTVTFGVLPMVAFLGT